MGFRTTDRDLSTETRPLEEVSSFSENFGASVGLIIDEESSYSSFLGNESFRERNQQIRQLVQEGLIDEDLFKANSRNIGRGNEVDYNKIVSTVMKSKGYKGPDLKSDLTLTQERNAMLTQRRKYRDDIFRRSGGSGTAGSFLGMASASMLDPVNIASAIITPATAGVRGASRAMYTLSQAGKGFAYGAAAGAAVEPFIHSWKEEIGVEYTLSDSMFNIIASGVLNGTIDGVAANITHRFKTKKEFDDELKAELTKDVDEFDGEIKNENEMPKVSKDKVKSEEVKQEEIEPEDRPQQEKVKPKEKVVTKPMSLYEKHLAEVELRNQGLDAEEAADLSQLMHETTNYPDPKADAKEVIKDLEDTQERMEVGQAKTDDEPLFGPDETEEIDAAYDAIENEEILAYFDDLMDDTSLELDNLTMKLGCLNGN